MVNHQISLGELEVQQFRRLRLFFKLENYNFKDLKKKKF